MFFWFVFVLHQLKFLFFLLAIFNWLFYDENYIYRSSMLLFVIFLQWWGFDIAAAGSGLLSFSDNVMTTQDYGKVKLGKTWFLRFSLATAPTVLVAVFSKDFSISLSSDKAVVNVVYFEPLWICGLFSDNGIEFFDFFCSLEP